MTQFWANLQKGFLTAAALVLFVMLTGCAKEVGRYSIELTADPTLKDRVTVDVVAIPPSVYKRWYEVKVDDYFSGATTDASMRGGESRSGALQTHDFGGGQQKSWTISGDDPVWNQWTRSGEIPSLFVIANLDNPTKLPTGPGTSDFRRLIIPLDKDAWRNTDVNKTKMIRIRVDPAGLKLVTGPDPKYQAKNP